MIIGIDPSLTSTGIAWEDGRTRVIKTKPNHKRNYDTEHRLNIIVSSIEGIIYQQYWEDYDAKVKAIIEGQSFGSKGASRDILAYLHWAIKISCVRYTTEYVIVAPRELKKFATGNGSASKDEMKYALKQHECIILSTGMGNICICIDACDSCKTINKMTSDEVDAYWLMLWGKEHA